MPMKNAAAFFTVPHSYYGRIVGLVVGLSIGGTALLVLLLVILGYGFDQLLMHVVLPRQVRARRRQLCSESVLALCAKALIAGGVETTAAMTALRKSLLSMHGQQEMAMDIIRREKDSLHGYEEHAARLVQLLAHQPQDLDLLMRTLVIIAVADGPLSEGEEEFLLHVASILGIRNERLIELVRTAQQFKQKEDTKLRGKPAEHAAVYRVLGLTPAAKWEDIRRAYRKLVVQHHPDKLQSSGKGAAEIKRAEAEMARINEAYATLEVLHQKKDASSAN